MDNDFTFYCPFCDHGIVRGMNGREDRAKPNERAMRHVTRHFRGETTPSSQPASLTAEWLRRHVCQLCPHDTLRHDGLGNCRVSCRDCRSEWVS